MGIFDRFRAQPKWKHADAAIRLSAVEELSLEEHAVLAALAREDADARVRRAAIRKVYDPALLREAAERDEDADVREEANQVLLDLAVGAFEDSNESESLKALDQLVDARHVVTVAKGASAESVSLAALSRLSDPKVLGSVARRSEHASTRLEALGRLTDPEEIFTTALKAEHRDVALAAVERVAELEQLKAIAARGAQKAAVRRARGRVREMEPKQAPVEVLAEAGPAQQVPDWNRERDRLCRVVDEASRNPDRAIIESRLASAEAEWAGITAEAGVPADIARQARFDALRERARQALATLKRAEAERAAKAEQSRREQAERALLCESVEALAAAVGRDDSAARALIPVTPSGSEEPTHEIAPVHVEGVRGRIEATRQQWRALSTPALREEEIERFERRFERACAACEREVERLRTAQAHRARLQELIVDAEALAGAPPSAERRARWTAVRQEWADLGGNRAAGSGLAARFDAAQATIVQRETEAREREERRAREELQRLLQLCERVETTARGESLALKDGERALKDIRAGLDALATVPKKERAEIADRLKAAQASLFPRVSELREADEWVRWANVGIQENLCRQAEALREVADAGEAAEKLRELQQQWKQASAVPRDKAQGLWERFKKAGDEVRARADAHFAQQAAERNENLARKEALCQQAEALADSSDWIRTAETIKQLQAQWTAVGPVPRGHEKAVWERFRGACDTFFTRRRDDLTRRKEEWTANLARKEALIAQVESLPGGLDWGRAVEEVKRLQGEWKAIGPVRKNRSEELWQRFRAACDGFFERYQQRDQNQVKANLAAREAICNEIEGLLPADAAQPGEAPEGLFQKVTDLRGRWQQVSTLVPRDVLARLTARFTDALASLARLFPHAFEGSDLDATAVRRRAERLCERVEQAFPAEERDEASSAESPATILAARLRDALAANTIGGVAVADVDARWRAAESTVKEAQAAWTVFASLPVEFDPSLGDRFHRACARILEAAEKRKR